MANNIKICLEKINNVSRQLLSLLSSLEELQDNFQSELQQNNSLSTPTKKRLDGDIASKKMMELMSERNQLIINLFKNQPHKEINAELTLINEMMLLDSELLSRAKISKKAIADHVLKVKNSSKVTRLYQKY